MVIDFEKTILFHAEIDDKQFKNEDGDIDENLIVNFCEAIDSPTDNEDCWIFSDELKNITWKDSQEKLHEITESEYERFRNEREVAEHCYECSGNGDDYDDEGNSNCDDCPFNWNNDEFFDWHDDLLDDDKINPQDFIQKFCDKIVEFYEGYVDKQSIIDKVKKIFEDTKFSYLEISPSNRIFLFAENPMVFIMDNEFWNYLQKWVNEEYNTFMAIGMCKLDESLNMGEFDKMIPIFNIADYIR